MTVVDGIQYGDHSRYYSNKTLAQLKKSRGKIWERAQREIRSNLDSFSKEKWVKKLSKNIVSIGIAYKAVALLIKLLPRRLSNWIVGKIYAR